MWYYKIAVNINKGDNMRECYEKSIRWTIIMFVSIMIYCVASIINKFSYLDLLWRYL